jgi:hypothetical protein
MKKEKLLNTLSQAIFKLDLIALKKNPLAFVCYQEKQYRRYQDEVRKKALPIMNKKSLNTREYKIIEEWFLANIPLHVVLRSVDACLESQRGTGRAIYSLAFFKAHVAGEYRYYCGRMIGSRRCLDPWEYDEWLAGMR